MQFLFSPVHGALSDRFGRRPVILISNFGLGLDYVLMALAPNLWWLFVGRVSPASRRRASRPAYAYVADVTPPEQRAARFGMLGVAFGAGFVLGPALGGLAGASIRGCRSGSPRRSASLNALYGLLVLPELLPPSGACRFEWRRANPFGALSLAALASANCSGSPAVNFLGNLAHASAAEHRRALHDVPLRLGRARGGLDAMAVVGVCAMIVQGGLIGPTVKRFGERRALLFGLVVRRLRVSCVRRGRDRSMVLLGIPLLALWGIADRRARR